RGHYGDRGRKEMIEQVLGEIKEAEVMDIDEDTGEVTVSVDAEDSDSYILYYEYSLDGGESYSELNEWPRPEWNTSLQSNTFTVQVPYDQPIDLRVNVFNGFDLWTESNIISMEAIPDPERLKREAELAAAREEELRKEQEQLQKEQELESADRDLEVVMPKEEVQEISVEEYTASEEDTQSLLFVVIILGIILLAMIFVAFFMAGKIDLLLRDKKRR
ncbi:MAG: hypothetical protein K2N82_11400, partial [Lachnospiraceae bacterium]|nr:hypothetical protein [Lachnospiraceae bacterium]